MPHLIERPAVAAAAGTKPKHIEESVARSHAHRWLAILAAALTAACHAEPARDAIVLAERPPAAHPDLDSLERVVDSLAQERDSVAPWFTPRAPQRRADVHVEAPTLLVFYPDLAHVDAARDPEIVVAVHAFRPTLPSLARLAEGSHMVFLERFVPVADESFRIHDRTQRQAFLLTVPPDGIGYALLTPGRRPRVHIGEIPMVEWPAILTGFLAHRLDEPVSPAS